LTRKLYSILGTQRVLYSFVSSAHSRTVTLSSELFSQHAFSLLWRMLPCCGGYSAFGSMESRQFGL